MALALMVLGCHKDPSPAEGTAPSATSSGRPSDAEPPPQTSTRYGLLAGWQKVFDQPNGDAAFELVDEATRRGAYLVAITDKQDGWIHVESTKRHSRCGYRSSSGSPVDGYVPDAALLSVLSEKTAIEAGASTIEVDAGVFVVRGPTTPADELRLWSPHFDLVVHTKTIPTTTTEVAVLEQAQMKPTAKEKSAPTSFSFGAKNTLDLFSAAADRGPDGSLPLAAPCLHGALAAPKAFVRAPEAVVWPFPPPPASQDSELLPGIPLPKK